MMEAVSKAPAAKKPPAKKAAAAVVEPPRETRRVVLKRERVLVLPEGFDPSAVKLTDQRELKKLIAGVVTEAWVVAGEFVGDSKDKAIEAYAGKPGTDSAKVGTYKAPTASAWAGGARYIAPPKPLVEKQAID